MNDAAKERSMADIIKLDSANDRSFHGVKAKNSPAINGPAQILSSQEKPPNPDGPHQLTCR
jgi:hypothetical protein